MKRFLAPLILVIALALPAQAVAGTKTYSGPIAPSGSVSLKVKIKDGTPKKVTDITFSAVPVTCNEGANTVSLHYPATGQVSHATIKDKEFSISAGTVQTGAGVEFGGKVKKKSASGTIQFAGDKASGETNCVSGVLNWTASR